MRKFSFCGIFATLFVTTTIILLASCSQDDDYYESDMYTLAEMETRSGGGDPGNGGGTYVYPTSEEILSNDAVRKHLDKLWKQTIKDATEDGRHELGCLICQRKSDLTYYFQDLPAGSNITGPTEAHITLPGNLDSEVCAVFHTHTTLEYFPEKYWRYTGPSDTDKSGSHAAYLPCFVYDYTGEYITGRQIKNYAGDIYVYGQPRRCGF